MQSVRGVLDLPRPTQPPGPVRAPPLQPTIRPSLPAAIPPAAKPAPAPTPPAAKAQTEVARSTIGVWAGALGLAAGVLHFVLAPAHLAEARGQGLFFLLLATAQVVWGLLYANRQRPIGQVLGMAAVVVMPLVAYFGSRIITPPFASAPEGFDTVGIATVGVEAVAGILLAVQAFRNRMRFGRWGAAAIVATGLLGGLALSGAVYGAGIGAATVFPDLSEPEGGHHEASTGDESAAPAEHAPQKTGHGTARSAPAGSVQEMTRA